MTQKEFKAEMQALVENAKCVDECVVNRFGRSSQTRKSWESVVGSRTYRWFDVDPQEFAAEQIKKFKNESASISRESMCLKADNWSINKRQKTLAWLWENKDKWKSIVKLYKKYETHRDEVREFKRKCDFYYKYMPHDAVYEKMHKFCTAMENDVNKKLGRKDLFYLYDSMPYNWLAMA